MTSTQYRKDEEDYGKNEKSQTFDEIRFFERHASHEVLEEKFIIHDPVPDNEHLKHLPMGFNQSPKESEFENDTAETQYKATRKSQRTQIVPVIPTAERGTATKVGQGQANYDNVN